MIYIREAHPVGPRQSGANVREGIIIQDPQSLEERREVAKDFASQFKVSIPIYIDTLDDKVNNTYSGWPDRLYIIGTDGKIAYKGGPGPRGFRVADLPGELEKLLAVGEGEGNKE